MKRAILGSLVCLGLVIAGVGFVGRNNRIFAQQAGRLASSIQGTSPPAVAAGSELVVVSSPAGEKGGQLLTVIDPRQTVMSVYRIESATGKIALESVRNISWDLQMMEWNTDKPTPTEIRSMSQPK